MVREVVAQNLHHIAVMTRAAERECVDLPHPSAEHVVLVGMSPTFGRRYATVRLRHCHFCLALPLFVLVFQAIRIVRVVAKTLSDHAFERPICPDGLLAVYQPASTSAYHEPNPAAFQQ